MKRWISFRINGILFLGIFLLIGSCVPTAKFRELENRSNRLSDERDQLMQQNERLSVDNAEMKSKISILEEELDVLSKDKKNLQASFDSLEDEYRLLDRKFEDIQQSQEALLKGHNRETQRLITQLQKIQEDLQLKEDRLRELEQTANNKMRELEKLQNELAERNIRMVELEKILFAKDSIMRALKNTIAEALFGFEKEGLSVSVRNGKVYVSMEEKLLFKTGSIEVDPKGVSALKRLAAVLEDNPDIYITIEGHTDDVPVKTNPSYADNWDLSVKRATSIVRILLDNSNIDPKRLIASGRGEYLPVDPVKTPEARQKNRRTEIILTPNLDELYKLLESK